MTNDDRLAWLGKPVPAPRVIPETILWTFETGGHLVTATRRDVELGPKLRVFLNRELLWSEVVRDGSLDRLSDETRAYWGTKG